MTSNGPPSALLGVAKAGDFATNWAMSFTSKRIEKFRDEARQAVHDGHTVYVT